MTPKTLWFESQQHIGSPEHHQESLLSQREPLSTPGFGPTLPPNISDKDGKFIKSPYDIMCKEKKKTQDVNLYSVLKEAYK